MDVASASKKKRSTDIKRCKNINKENELNMYLQPQSWPLILWMTSKTKCSTHIIYVWMPPKVKVLMWGSTYLFEAWKCIWNECILCVIQVIYIRIAKAQIPCEITYINTKATKVFTTSRRGISAVNTRCQPWGFTLPRGSRIVGLTNWSKCVFTNKVWYFDKTRFNGLNIDIYLVFTFWRIFLPLDSSNSTSFWSSKCRFGELLKYMCKATSRVSILATISRYEKHCTIRLLQCAQNACVVREKLATC